MSKITRIAVSPLTGRIYRGRVNKVRDSFIGDKEDVTSDVLAAVIEKAAFHGGTFEIEGGERKWTVTVIEVQPQQFSAMSRQESSNE